MKTSLICFIVLAFVAAGCSTTERFSRDQAKARAFYLNVNGIRGPVTIQLNTRTEPYKAEFMTVQADSVYWSDYSTGAIASAPLAAIHEIAVRDRLTGMLHGSLAGTAAGLGVLGAIGTDSYGYHKIYLYAFSGYTGGAILGYLFGFQRNFVFE